MSTPIPLVPYPLFGSTPSILPPVIVLPDGKYYPIFPDGIQLVPSNVSIAVGVDLKFSQLAAAAAGGTLSALGIKDPKVQQQINDAFGSVLDKFLRAGNSVSDPKAYQKAINDVFSISADVGVKLSAPDIGGKFTFKLNVKALEAITNPDLKSYILSTLESAFGFSSKEQGEISRLLNLKNIKDVRFSIPYKLGSLEPITFGAGFELSKKEFSRANAEKNDSEGVLDATITDDRAGKYTISFGAKVGFKVDPTSPLKLSAGASASFSFSRSDIRSIEVDGKTRYVVKLKYPGFDEGSVYYQVPADFLYTIGFSAASLKSLKEISIEKIGYLPVSFTALGNELSNQTVQLKDAVGLATRGSSYAAYVSTVLGAAKLAQSSPLLFLVVNGPEIFEGILSATASLTRVYNDTFLPSNEALTVQHALALWNASRDQLVRVTNNPELYNDRELVFSFFLRAATQKYNQIGIGALISAALAEGYITIDQFKNVYDKTKGIREIVQLVPGSGLFSPPGLTKATEFTIGDKLQQSIGTSVFLKSILDLGGSDRAPGNKNAFNVTAFLEVTTNSQSDFLVLAALRQGVDPFGLVIALYELVQRGEARSSRFSPQRFYLNDGLNSLTDAQLQGSAKERRFLNVAVNLYHLLFGQLERQSVNSLDYSFKKDKNGNILPAIAAKDIISGNVSGLGDLRESFQLIRKKYREQTGNDTEFNYRVRAFVDWELDNGINFNLGIQEIADEYNRQLAYRRANGLFVAVPNAELIDFFQKGANGQYVKAFVGTFSNGKAVDRTQVGRVGSSDLDGTLQLDLAYLEEDARNFLTAPDVISLNLLDALRTANGDVRQLSILALSAINSLLEFGDPIVIYLQSELAKLRAAEAILGVSLDKETEAAVYASFIAFVSARDLAGAPLTEQQRADALLIYVRGFSPGLEFIRDQLVAREYEITSGSLDPIAFVSAEVAKVKSLSELRTALNDALAIARATGNSLGVILADIAKLFVDTQLAGLDGRTALDRRNSAIETGARLLGVTFSDFVRLIGRGDLAAFGAVIGDAGEFAVNFNVAAGQSVNQISATADGFRLLGDALIAAGRSGRDATLIIAGTAVSSVSGVIDGLYGTKKGQVSAVGLGFGAAGQIASVIGELSGSRIIRAVGVGLSGVTDVQRLINNSNVSALGRFNFNTDIQLQIGQLEVPNLTNLDFSTATIGIADPRFNIDATVTGSSSHDTGIFGSRNNNGGIRGDGVVAAAALASSVVGALIGGEAGQRIAAAGSLTQSLFGLATLRSGASPAALAVGALQSFLTLVGVRLGPEINFGLNALATSLAIAFGLSGYGAPIAAALFGIQVITGFLRAGKFERTIPLYQGIDADRDGQADDNALLLQEFRRNFFGSVKQLGATVYYDVNTVNPGLLREAQVALRKVEVEAFVNFSDYGDGEYKYQETATIRLPYGGQLKLGLRGSREFYDGTGEYEVLQGTNDIPAGTILRGQYDRSVGNGLIFKLDTGLVERYVLGNFDAINPGTNGGYNSLQNYLREERGNSNRFRVGFPFNAFAEDNDPNTPLPEGRYNADFPIANGSGLSITIIDRDQARYFENLLGIGTDGTVRFLGRGDERLANGTQLRQITDTLDVRFTQAKNDPNIYFYLDLNQDGLPDLIRVGQTGSHLVVQGDGKVEVTLLDGPGAAIDDRILGNNFAEVEKIALLRTEIYLWAASHPEVWGNGRDLVSLYRAAVNYGAINDIEALHNASGLSFARLIAGDFGVDTINGLSATGDISKRLGLVFDAGAYVDTYKDILEYSGGDPAIAAKHYINYGNAELRKVNAEGNIIAPYWGPNSTVSYQNDYTSYYYTDGYSRLNVVDTYYKNGYRQLDYIDSTNVAPWNYVVRYYDPSGRLLTQTEIDDNGDHYRDEYSYDPSIRYGHIHSDLDVYDRTTRKETFYNRPEIGGPSRLVEEWDVADKETYNYKNYHYNGGNQLYYSYEGLDDGSNLQTVYNLDGSENFSSYVVAFGTNGRQLSVTYTLRDGDTRVESWENGAGYAGQYSVTLKDTSYSQLFDRQVSYYTSDGQRIQQLDEFYDDGTAQITYYDVAGAPWAGDPRSELTDTYDADGRVVQESSLYDTGNRVTEYWQNGRGASGEYSVETIDANTDEDWYRSVRNYADAHGVFYRQTGVRDNGDTWDYAYKNGRVTIATEIDSNFDEVWDRQLKYYTADGNNVQQVDQYNDDGTGQSTYYDVVGAPWAGDPDTLTIYSYDFNRNLVSFYALHDNGNSTLQTWQNGQGNLGEYTVAEIDDNNIHADYASITTTYNNAGQYYRQVWVFDDGDSREYGYEPTSGRWITQTDIDSNFNESWDRQVKYVTLDGRNFQQIDQYNDDGTRQITYYDVPSAPWAGDPNSEVTDYYDVEGRIVSRSSLADTGNQVVERWENGAGVRGEYSAETIDGNNDEWYQSYRQYYDANNTFYRQTGVYDNGDSWDYAYADNGARYTSTTEIDSNFDEEWDRRTSLYTADGQRVYELDQYNDDGTTSRTLYASAGDWFVEYTYSYAADGFLSEWSGLRSNGNRWDYLYGRDGSVVYSEIDANNDEGYRSYGSTYNGAGQFIANIYVTDNGDTYEDIYNGTGARVSYRYGDVSNSTSEYRTRTDLYRGDGTVYERDQVLDNGTTSRTLYASAGDWFVEYTYSYAADGFLSEWSGLRSNGNRWDYLYGRDGSVVYSEIDANNDEGYRSYGSTYNGAGQFIANIYVTDNGDTYEDIYNGTGARVSYRYGDVSNSTSEYRTRTDLYRGDGTVYERDQVLDNGTTSRTLYASAGDWFVEYTYSYAADGFLSEWSGLRSNGNRWDYLYGRDGSVVYSEIDANNDEGYRSYGSTYNGAGQFIANIYVTDNGDTYEDIYNGTGARVSYRYGDVSNSTSEYRTRTDLYRGDGTVYERDQVLDNGTTSRTLYASAGDWFVEYTYSYAADGFLSEWSGLRSNGNRWDYLYGRDGSVVYSEIDANNDEGYRSYGSTYNGAGQFIANIYVTDNGDTYEDIYNGTGARVSYRYGDVSNSTSEYRTRTDLYRGDGTVYERDQVLDNGTTSRTLYASAGDWFVEYTYSYAADGFLSEWSGLRSNGNRWDYLYGRDGSVVYSEIDANNDEGYRSYGSTYNGAGQFIANIYVTDNGDTYEDIYNGTGARVSYRYGDVSNSTSEYRTRTDLYRGDGTVYERDQVLDNGTTSRTLYASAGDWFVEYTYSYAADGFLSEWSGLRSNGNRWDYLYGRDGSVVYSEIDANNDEGYRSYGSTYNGAGQFIANIYVTDNGDTYEDIYNGTGARVSYRYGDVSNSTSEYRTRTDLYRGDGTVYERDQVLDNGTTSRTLYASAGDWFVEYTYSYAADGFLSEWSGLRSNGNRWDYLYGRDGSVVYSEIDANNDEGYRSYGSTYNGAGQFIANIYVTDNGDTYEDIYNGTGARVSYRYGDVSNSTSEYRTRTDLYRGDGTVYERDQVLDNGTTSRTLYASAGDWFVEYTYSYAADGFLSEWSGLRSNGNRWDYLYGRDGSVVYSEIDANNDEGYRSYGSTYNGAGQFIANIYVTDNGDTYEDIYNGTGARVSYRYGDVSNSTSEYRTRTDLYRGDGTVYERDQVLDNGTTSRTLYASAGDWFVEYTYSYAADGFLSEWSGLRSNGNRWDYLYGRDGSVVYSEIDANNDEWYRSYSYSYDANGQFYRYSGVRDNGDAWDYEYTHDSTWTPVAYTEIDSNNDAVWSRQTSLYTGDGRQVYQLNQVNDDGTREETYYEINNQWAGWSDYTNYYDTQNRIVRQTGLADNGNRWDRQWENGAGNAGTSSHTEIDANNDEWYQSYTNINDTSGTKIIQQTGTADNGDTWQWIWENGYGNAGTSERIDWDTSGTKPWWHQVADYNAANQLSRFETYYDDNTKVIDNFSNDANAGWTKRTDLYSAAGALTSQTYT